MPRRGDPRVAGILVRLAETEHGLAVAQELRDAVRRFRAGGKFAIAYADTFGELGSGNEGYYLATAFDEIELQPVGLVGLTGIAAQVPFARDLLASLGVRFEVLRRAEYKIGLGEPDRQPALRPQPRAAGSTPRHAERPARGRNRRGPQARARRGAAADRPRPVHRRGGAGRGADRLRALPATSRSSSRCAAPAPTRRRCRWTSMRRSVAAPARAGGERGPDPRRGADPPRRAVRSAPRSRPTSWPRRCATSPTTRRSRAVLLRINSGGGSAVASETIRRAVLASARGRASR